MTQISEAAKQRYQKWIADNVTGTGYGDCREVTEAMGEAFPELKRVRGHYHCDVWGKRAHWWLVDVDGTVVDPTAKQFPSKGCGEYEPWDESQPEPTGRCMNCNEYCYDGDSFCSRNCHVDYMADFVKT